MSTNFSRKETIFLSKSMTQILRHRAKDLGFNIDDEGFIKLNELIDYLKTKVQFKESFAQKRDLINVDLIKQVVDLDKTESKGRFFLIQEKENDENSWKIRANQGHSFEVKDLELKRITSKDVGNYGLIVHGSYSKNRDAIKASGLKKMSRTHVHMTDLMTEKGPSLMRRDINLFVIVNLFECVRDGLEFFESTNNVILSKDDIPPKYLTLLDRAGNNVPCIGVIVYGFDKSKKLYVAMVKSHSDVWSFPKGKKEEKEITLLAGLRELKEESSLTLNDITLKEHKLLIENSNKGNPSTALYVAQYNKLIDPQNPTLEVEDTDELVEARWMLRDEIVNWDDSKGKGRLYEKRRELLKDLIV